MAIFAVFCHALLLLVNAAALPHRRLLPQLRRRRLLLRVDATVLMVLGASAIFQASVSSPSDDTVASRTLAAAGFLMWVAGVALLALTPGRFPGAAAPARFAAQLLQAAAGALF